MLEPHGHRLGKLAASWTHLGLFRLKLGLELIAFEIVFLSFRVLHLLAYRPLMLAVFGALCAC